MCQGMSGGLKCVGVVYELVTLVSALWNICQQARCENVSGYVREV